MNITHLSTVPHTRIRFHPDPAGGNPAGAVADPPAGQQPGGGSSVDKAVVDALTVKQPVADANARVKVGDKEMTVTEMASQLGTLQTQFAAAQEAAKVAEATKRLYSNAHTDPAKAREDMVMVLRHAGHGAEEAQQLALNQYPDADAPRGGGSKDKDEDKTGDRLANLEANSDQAITALRAFVDERIETGTRAEVEAQAKGWFKHAAEVGGMKQEDLAKAREQLEGQVGNRTRQILREQLAQAREQNPKAQLDFRWIGPAAKKAAEETTWALRTFGGDPANLGPNRGGGDASDDLLGQIRRTEPKQMPTLDLLKKDRAQYEQQKIGALSDMLMRSAVNTALADRNGAV